MLAIGAAALSVAAARSVGNRSPFEFGLLYPVLRYERALALAGLGFALAQMSGRALILNGAIFIAGIGLGGVAAGWIGAALSAGADIFRYIFLVVPACSALTGAALVSPPGMRVTILPVAVLASSMALGMVINFGNAMPEEWFFAGGTILSGAWIVATALLLWLRFERAWFRTAGRIFGSWLIAIGLMLAAFHLIPPSDIGLLEAVSCAGVTAAERLIGMPATAPVPDVPDRAPCLSG